ncbi:hypothetical protein POTOM_024543 [Populus tomentosa]|uniref:Uncharacterized protein n=1 Tax=Populus tomentosa TaxID=118781 RepID=A0A8X7ZGI2_POPTO|nr:hypothetical protein POTOM_024543 [Populus tomentosa]
MAEGVLFSIVEEIIKKLGTLAAQDVALWWGLKDQLRKLNDTVTKIKAMIPDAEARKQNHEIEDWLKKLQEAVYDVEDVLDNFSTQVLRKQLTSGIGVSREVCASFSRSNKFVYGLRMVHKVKALRERLDGIETESRGFNFDFRDDERAFLTTVREQTTSPEPEVLVGRESDIVAVKTFLLNSNEEDAVPVISIVGTGGLGKTTLAQHAFNDEQVDKHFDEKRWVSVSGSLDVRKILKGFVESDSDQLEILKNEIKNKFGGKRFLLVLDDVRDGEDNSLDGEDSSLDGKKWGRLMKLMKLFQSDDDYVPRTRIMVTTRSHVIAKLTSTKAPHVLEGLSVDESWNIFRRNAFCQGQESELVDEKIIKEEIVGRCRGVPLVIKAIASLMSFKDRALCTKVDSGRNRIRDSTRHVSLDMELNFPQQIRIPLPSAKRLRTLILQSVEWDEGTWESICQDFKRLRVLVLPNLTIRKVSPLIEKLKHLRYLDLSNNHMEALPYSITNLVNLQVLKLNGCKNLKELPRDINKLINLRHLDLGLCRSLEYNMPLGIGKLTSLQTLSYFVVAKNNSPISKNIGGLDELSGLNELTIEWEWDDGSDSDTDLYDKMLLSLQPNLNLQELRLIEHGGVSFPSWLSHLSNLVKIRVEKCRRLKHIPPLDEIPSLEVLLIEDMESLEYIDSEGGGGKGVSMFFPSLKKLEIKSCGRLKGWWKKSRDESTIEEELIMLYFPRLSSLSICKCPNLTSMPLFPTLDESLYLKETSSMPLQQTMKMKWPVSSSSSSSSSFIHPLSKLKNLDIGSVGDMESLPEVGLQNLSSLQQLSISGCGRLKSQPLPDQGMHSLQQLSISGCKTLESLRLPDQGMHSLQKLDISNCRELKCLSQSQSRGMMIPYLPSLQELRINDCSEELRRRITRWGVEWRHIKHIPRIVIDGDDIQH